MLADDGYAVEAVKAPSGEQLIEKREFSCSSPTRTSAASAATSLRPREEMARSAGAMITAYATPKLAVEAIKAGAIDYLAKPFAPEELILAVSRCAERFRLLADVAALRARAGETYQLHHIIGDCPKIVELRQLIETVAPTNATVLILGESGTGKELIAGALHSLSRRRERNYIRINCAAIPETLLESELFGHEKGAFTGALKQLGASRLTAAPSSWMKLRHIRHYRPSSAFSRTVFTRVGATTNSGQCPPLGDEPHITGHPRTSSARTCITA